MVPGVKSHLPAVLTKGPGEAAPRSVALGFLWDVQVQVWEDQRTPGSEFRGRLCCRRSFENHQYI